MAEALRKTLRDAQTRLERLSMDELLEQRYKRLMSYGRFEE